MRLNNEQLSFIFNEYLTEYIIPGSTSHLPIFTTFRGGVALTKRLRKILRFKELTHADHSDTVDIEELFRIAQEYLKKYPKVKIVGLEHWFTIKDIDILYSIYDKYFIK